MLFRCKIDAKLLPVIENEVVDQSNASDLDRGSDKDFAIPNLFNRLQGLSVNDRDVIQCSGRFLFDRVFHDLGERCRIWFTALEGSLSGTQSVE